MRDTLFLDVFIRQTVNTPPKKDGHVEKCLNFSNMAIFYRAVRNLVDFSLVTKLTKHVSKVREMVKKCEKIRQKDCKTFFMTSDSQKNDITIFGFLFL